MKIFYAICTTEHFTRQSPIICELLRRGHQIRIEFRNWRAFADLKSLEFIDEREKNISFGPLPQREGRWRNVIWAIRKTRSHLSYSFRSGQSALYLERSKKRIPEALRKVFDLHPLLSMVIYSRWFYMLLGLLHKLFPSAANIRGHLAEFAPDVVVAAPGNVNNSEEIEYVLAARDLGIGSVIPVSNWDSLSTKQLVHVVPDALLVWNEIMAREARYIHHVPPERIIVVGSPWLYQSTVISGQMSRREFCKQAGLPDDGPFCLYLGSSENIVGEREIPVIEEFAASLRKCPQTQNINVLVRAHPENCKHYVGYKSRVPGVVFFPQPGAWPNLIESRQALKNSIEYCLAAVGINSTSMLDTLVNDRPCVAILSHRFDETQAGAVHFNQLVEAGVVELAESADAAANWIATLHLKGETEDKKLRRQRFVTNFAKPLGNDMSPVEAIATAIEQIASGKNATQVKEHIAQMIAARKEQSAACLVRN
ncbi:MAG TPA: hypothetical protein V6D17_12365 [Candidatus Obscuribacterales bacterium]